MAKVKKKSKAQDLEAKTDPTSDLDTGLLLAEAQKVQKLLTEDLLQRAKNSKNVTKELKATHNKEREAKRTADNFEEWQERLAAQVAASWILSAVFVRTLEDQGLLKQARIAGPEALDSQRNFRDLAPSLGDRDYLKTVFKELSKLPAGAELFDAAHNPVWLLSPSAEGVRALLTMFRTPNAETPALRFGQKDTRFLGDLYQDLDEGVRKRYALLQTPKFIESFILDRTLERAIEKFGVSETEIIDPTCGSGHFLLGAFERLYDHIQRQEPNLNPAQAAIQALKAVAGADINPYAVAIAKFRLTLAYLEKSGCKKLSEAPHLPLRVVVADSLLHNPHLKQGSLMDLAGVDKTKWGKKIYELEDEETARKILHRTYAAVVGNPPYITVKDEVLRERYRKDYESAAGKYSLSVPFMERFFQLARKGGFVGKITANSFMKREFGKAVIEKYLPTVNLNLVINTSGAYIPGHGTPTVLLFGTSDEPQGREVLTVMAKRGEPTTPEEPEKGKVWSSIAEHWSEEGFENDYISVAKVERKTYGKHPWSLGGGGAAELKELLEETGKKTLADLANSIGFMAITGEDEAFVASPEVFSRHGLPSRTFGYGEVVRDWSVEELTHILFPYRDTWEAEFNETITLWLWPYKQVLRSRLMFGKTQEDAGLFWFEFRHVGKDKISTPLSIAFAEVASHNHFVLDRGGKVFKQTAPIIKLKAGATEEDHLALLAYLNSSTICFYMKQVCHQKQMMGGDGIRVADESKVPYQFSGTALGMSPVCSIDNSQQEFLAKTAREIEALVAKKAEAVDTTVQSIWTGKLPVLAGIAELETLSKETQSRLVTLQEEIDWIVYEMFGLINRNEVERIDSTCQIYSAGQRPFELMLLDRGITTTNNDYPVSLPENPDVQKILQKRINIIKNNKLIQLIETPNYKRRWIGKQGLFNHAANSLTETVRESILQLWFGSIEKLYRESEAGSVIAMRNLLPKISESNDNDTLLSFIFGEKYLPQIYKAISSESVPYLSAYIYKPSGLEKRADWECTWELQRLEDLAENVGDIPVPPKYKPVDFLSSDYWRLRGKLDVPKERFISYPGLESDEDGELLFGWAGWNHLQRAKALAALYVNRRDNESWGSDRLTPVLAGLLELIPWVLQWHNEPSSEFGGLRLGDYFRQFLDTECLNFGLSYDDLRAWRPAEKARGSGRKEKKSLGQVTE